MAISYAKVSKTQYIFRQLTGLTTEEFEKIVKKAKPEWEKEERQKKRHGRKSHVERLDVQSQSMMVYYHHHLRSHYGTNITWVRQNNGRHQSNTKQSREHSKAC